MRKIILLFLGAFLLMSCEENTPDFRPDDLIKIDNYVMPLITKDITELKTYLLKISTNITEKSEGNVTKINLIIPNDKENLFSSFYYKYNFEDGSLNSLSLTYKFNKSKTISSEIKEMVSMYLKEKGIIIL